jgi:hypothetical protein
MKTNKEGEFTDTTIRTPETLQIDACNLLPITVRHSDHRLEQVWRNETHAVYKHFGATGKFIGWEAIKIKKKKAEDAFGKSYPNREVYPSDSKNSMDFGRIAFSVGGQYDLDHAIERAKRIP